MPGGAAVIKYEGKRGTGLADQVRRRRRQASDGDSRRRGGRRLSEARTRKPSARLGRVERDGVQKAKAGHVRVVRRRVARLRPGETRMEARHADPVPARPRTAQGGLRRDVLLGAVRPSQISGYVSAMLDDFAAKTVNLDISVLHDIFKCAAAEELCFAPNPAPGPERPRRKRRKWRDLEAGGGDAGRAGLHGRPGAARVPHAHAHRDPSERAHRSPVANVDLLGNVLRVRRRVKNRVGRAAIAIPPMLSEALGIRSCPGHQGDGDRRSCHLEPRRALHGGRLRGHVPEGAQGHRDRRLRSPVSHDLRHASLTNGGLVSGPAR